VAEVGEGELDDVQGAEEVGVELGAQVRGVLVFAGAYYAVARAAAVYLSTWCALRLQRVVGGLYTYLLHDYIYPPKPINAPLHRAPHRRPHSDIAQQTQTPLVPALHLRHCVLARAADGGDIVAMAQGALDERAADVAGCAEDEPDFLGRGVGVAGWIGGGGEVEVGGCVVGVESGEEGAGGRGVGCHGCTWGKMSGAGAWGGGVGDGGAT